VFYPRIVWNVSPDISAKAGLPILDMIDGVHGIHVKVDDWVSNETKQEDSEH